MHRSRFLILVCVVVALGCDARSARSGAATQRLAVPPVGGRFPAIQVIEFLRGLRNPVYITHDGTKRLFVVEQPGTVKLVLPSGVQKTPYLDIKKQVNFGGECGLLSIAFHPDFQKNGRIYVNYTAKSSQLKTVVSEFHVDPKSTKIDPSTERILLTVDQPFPNHNGGQLQFGPDGMLYIGMGDGGSANDPNGNAQNKKALLGKMLRISVDTRDKYAIPKDNPFIKDRSYAPEVYALGLRNPWRFSFDRKTGDCYAGDVGQNTFEEVDLIRSGGNYGWNQREGFHAFQDAADRKDFAPPLAEYGRDKGLSITGGYVYRGKLFPSIQGVYFYADYSSGRIWGLKQEGGKVTSNAELDVTRDGKPILNRIQPVGFGEDVDGELYLCDYNGTIYRIAAPGK